MHRSTRYLAWLDDVVNLKKSKTDNTLQCHDRICNLMKNIWTEICQLSTHPCLWHLFNTNCRLAPRRLKWKKKKKKKSLAWISNGYNHCLTLMMSGFHPIITWPQQDWKQNNAGMVTYLNSIFIIPVEHCAVVVKWQIRQLPFKGPHNYGSLFGN